MLILGTGVMARKPGGACALVIERGGYSAGAARVLNAVAQKPGDGYAPAGEGDAMNMTRGRRTR